MFNQTTRNKKSYLWRCAPKSNDWDFFEKLFIPSSRVGNWATTVKVSSKNFHSKVSKLSGKMSNLGMIRGHLGLKRGFLIGGV